jgi:diamine N-acetyltransferase
MLRDANLDDAVTLAALATQVWLDTYATDGVNPAIANYVLGELSPARFRTLLQDEACDVLVAERDAHVLGYAVMRNGAACPCAPRLVAELATLYVQPRFSGNGLGSALFTAACSRARGGRGAAWVAVNARNSRAINFYRKHGMVEIGTTYFALDGKQHENHVYAFAVG